jgi:exosome complex exonuclease RRP6
MANLMRMFQSVPPVIRRRAEELLAVVKAAVSSAEGTSSDVDMVVNTDKDVADGEAASDMRGVVDSVEVSSADRLWSDGVSFSVCTSIF